MQTYKALSDFRAGGLVTSRGCPWSCKFCYSPAVWSRNVTSRSAHDVVDEVENLGLEYSIRRIRFEDDTFTTNRKRVVDICQEIRRRDLDIEWEARSRLDQLDEPLLLAMKKAGLLRIQIGIETISPLSLRAVDKGLRFDIYEDMFALIHKLDVGITATVIIGLPNETPKEMLETISWIREHLTYRDRFIRCMFTPFPGTRAAKDNSLKYLSHDLSLYTMDIPVVVSDSFSLDQLTEVKKQADELMCRFGPPEAIRTPMPQYAFNLRI